jgi:uncharacterized protein (DUF427 family)
MPPGRFERVPRRVRAYAGGLTVVDSTRALYGWEWPHYPQYYFPLDDVRTDLLVGEGRYEAGPFGRFEWCGLQAGEQVRPSAAKVLAQPAMAAFAGTVSFVWGDLDAWFEEDEQVFVHPRNPYSRVDALRSTRPVRVELDGVLLAESGSPVLVFETGLPTRYYLNRTDMDFSHLLRSDTVTECPYKGTTSDYWSVRVGGAVHPDLAWSYSFPTRELQPIAGLVAFYNEKVDLFVDGRPLDRPRTHFS